MAELGVSPPDSLMKHDAPLFVGIEPSAVGAKASAEGLSKLDDMINSMLPPRYVLRWDIYGYVYPYAYVYI